MNSDHIYICHINKFILSRFKIETTSIDSSVQWGMLKSTTGDGGPEGCQYYNLRSAGVDEYIARRKGPMWDPNDVEVITN
jgi:hypothetical protein